MNLFKIYHSDFFTIQYWKDENNNVGFSILPKECDSHQLERRKDLHDEPTIIPIREVFKSDFPSDNLDPLVHIHIKGDEEVGRFSAGTSMRGSKSTFELKFSKQWTDIENENTHIHTELIDSRNLKVIHTLVLPTSLPYTKSYSTFINDSQSEVTLEHLSSFSLSQLSPFQKDDAVDCYNVHRYLSTWSAEGRHQCQSIEELNLERSWAGHGVRSLRFGQVGSMPIKDYFPYVAFEDTQANVFWGARLECPSSWQLEVYRTADTLILSGGLADLEFGHWSKTVQKGESFKSPEATLSCVKGSLEELNDRLLVEQASINITLPESEHDLPIIFNEWCTSWGQPSEKNMLKLTKVLTGSQVKYIVMDDGWFNEKAGCQQGIGDWNIAHSIYPNGFKHLCQTIRKEGFIPGVWFEFESCTMGSEVFNQTEHLLHRDGNIIQKGARRFLDFRDPWVHDYLNKKVIQMLKENEVGYIKVDYNDTVGIGCDNPSSLGEGLREHIQQVQLFFQRMREEIPELVIEVCSSGGHRLDSTFMKLGSMGGFSDSHEGLDIPIIAANTAIHIQARQNQIWAVLRKEDSIQRLYYSLTATFLGRMCISGDIYDLNEKQMKVCNAAQEFYQESKDVIADGYNRIFRQGITSYVRPKGIQVAVRYSKDTSRALIVIHSFANTPKNYSVLLEQNYKIKSALSETVNSISINNCELNIKEMKDFTGVVLILEKT